jgi:EmrB/QacA subfamily drug resistance transporter
VSAAVAPRGSGKWAVLAIAAAGNFLAGSDFSIVVIAFPELTRTFASSTSTVVWVSLAFQLTSLGLVLPMGRLGDTFGKKKIYAIGLLIYAFGLLAGAVSPGVAALIGARAIQGVGSSMTAALSVALVVMAFPPSERGKAIGTLAAVAGVGLMTGPALGGLILDALGWRAIFYLRVPLAVLGFFLALTYLSNDTGSGDRGRRLDLGGAIALIVATSALVIGVNQGPERGWGSPEIVGLLGASAVALSVFLLVESRVAMPMVDLKLFRNRTFAVGSALLFLFTGGSVGVHFLMPFYLVGGVGLSASKAGLVLLTTPAIMTFLSPLSGQLADRTGHRVLTSVGLAVNASGLFLLSMLTIDAAIITVVAFLAIAGVGSSLFSIPNQYSMLSTASDERMGTVSALIPTLRSVGAVTGIAAASAIFASVVAGAGQTTVIAAGNVAQQGAIVDGVTVAFSVMAGVGLATTLLSLMRGRARA